MIWFWLGNQRTAAETWDGRRDDAADEREEGEGKEEAHLES